MPAVQGLASPSTLLGPAAILSPTLAEPLTPRAQELESPSTQRGLVATRSHIPAALNHLVLVPANPSIPQDHIATPFHTPLAVSSLLVLGPESPSILLAAVAILFHTLAGVSILPAQEPLVVLQSPQALAMATASNLLAPASRPLSSLLAPAFLPLSNLPALSPLPPLQHRANPPSPQILGGATTGTTTGTMIGTTTGITTETMTEITTGTTIETLAVARRKKSQGKNATLSPPNNTSTPEQSANPSSSTLKRSEPCTPRKTSSSAKPKISTASAIICASGLDRVPCGGMLGCGRAG